ncbi:MAG: hypothetical protein BalsKO_07060 [Balneolaceae bacterium]
MRVFLATLILFSISEIVPAQNAIKIGSKLFTESVILGEIVTQLSEEQGIETEYIDQLGGTRILWNALLTGEIDIYPDYTGTVIQEILGKPEISNINELNAELETYGVRATESLGFNNTYALGMLGSKAEELNINKISDLENYPNLKLGFSNEFLDRNDGWKGLQNEYKLPQTSVTGLDHDLAYRGLEAGNIEVIDLYSTDAEIEYYSIRTLDDDEDFFPNYSAIILYRLDLVDKQPTLIQRLESLEGKISNKKMVEMNAKVKLQSILDSKVASEFIAEELGIKTLVSDQTLWSSLWKNTVDHLCVW